jgi:alkanesulfonate monooxygenase SsuD/methylene tetrahydromethanopterin reductase-like flavin-dependent oxidoreductase (luciferase family)
MGPTYLVLVRGGDAAIVLYEGHDEDAARAEYERALSAQRDDMLFAIAAAATPEAVAEKREQWAKVSIVLTTVRAEAQLS